MKDSHCKEIKVTCDTIWSCNFHLVTWRNYSPITKKASIQMDLFNKTLITLPMTLPILPSQSFVRYPEAGDPSEVILDYKTIGTV